MPATARGSSLHRRIIGGHKVSPERLWAVAWSSGVFAVFWALIMGIWILRHYPHLFTTPAWGMLLEAIDGRKYIIGVWILAGGVVGLAGLIFRVRALSLASCVICIGWCGWIAAFQWFSPANVGAGFAILACSVYVHRFVLLLSEPPDDDNVGLRE